MAEGYITSSAGELFFDARGERLGNAPLVAIHGGPGFSSYYLEPLFRLSSHFEVTLYDQAGCGRARRAGPRKLFTIESFVDELEALRVAVGAERIVPLGHSFGGLIAVEYALRFPARVERLILASVSIDIPRWRRDADRLLSGLPLMARMVLREGERSGQLDSPVYLSALAQYYRKHVYGFDEKPDVLRLSEEHADSLTYNTMWGPNELVITGVCRDYDISSRLPEIRCPTLLTCGRFDEATPEAHAHFENLLPAARLEVFENSAHHPHLSETEKYLSVVQVFVTAEK
jgi:proline iminopeptidase